MRFFAARHNRRGIELEERGERQAAIDAYRRAIKSDPSWSVPWYNLGLLFKRERSWRDSLAHNQRATSLNQEDGDAWWNLGIAATALGEWRIAREAWRHCGIDIPDGDTPPQMNLGTTAVRLAVGEVVWCDRIDPARAVIRSVPLPDSGHRYGDLLLHDGARNGTRVLRGQEVPVFDAIELIEPSPFSTFVATFASLSAEDSETLMSRVWEQHQIDSEDWTENIEMLCAECSKGRVDRSEHRHIHATGSDRRIAFAAESGAALRSLIEEIIAFIPKAELIAFECVTPATTPQ